MILLYIDPGTGSMLFTIMIGIISAVLYGVRALWIKLKFSVSGGRSTSLEDTGVPYAIFCDDKRYYSIFKPLCDEFEKRKENTLYMTASGDDPMLNESYDHIKTEFIGEGNKAFAKMNLLKADIVLSSTPGLDVYQWKRSRDVKWYVHILHAANDPIMYKMFGLDYYDAVMLSGKYQIEQIRQLEMLRGLPPKELDLAGLPHMDMLKKRMDEEKGSSKGGRTVLLAPSWGLNSIFNRFGGRIIEIIKASGYHVIIRPHPQSFISEKEMIDRLMGEYPEDDNIEWDRTIDNFDALNRSDILISDFSGIIFDYALVFDKPVIYSVSSYDNGMMDAYWLHNAEWTFKALKEIGVELNEDSLGHLDEIISSCIQSHEKKAARDRAREETWANIGGATTFIADYVINKRNSMCVK